MAGNSARGNSSKSSIKSCTHAFLSRYLHQGVSGTVRSRVRVSASECVSWTRINRRVAHTSSYLLYAATPRVDDCTWSRARIVSIGWTMPSLTNPATAPAIT